MADIFMFMMSPSKNRVLFQVQCAKTWKTRKAAGRHVNVPEGEVLIPLYNAFHAFVGYGIQTQTSVRFKDGRTEPWPEVSDDGKAE